jgi:hypothetical protein
VLVLMRVLDRLAGDSVYGDSFGCVDRATTMLHGACIGADETAVIHGHGLAYHVVALPCTWRNMQSIAALEASDEVRQEQAPLARNRTIVAECDLLIACPSRMPEYRRSGTWATVRHARKAGKQVIIVWPNGDVTHEARGAVPA